MKDKHEIITNYVISRQEKFYNWALNIFGCVNKAKESVSILNLAWLTKNKFEGELIESRMDYYSIGIIQNNKKSYSQLITRDLKLKDYDKTIDKVDYIKDNEFYQTLYENELRVEGFTDDQVLKLSRIRSFLRKCSPVEQNLYKMYFIENLSYRKIAKKCNLHYITIHTLINKLKNKLREASNSPQTPLF